MAIDDLAAHDLMYMQALDGLTVRQYKALLYKAMGMTVSEIACALMVTQGVVYRDLQRAKLVLRAALGKDVQDKDGTAGA